MLIYKENNLIKFVAALGIVLIAASVFCAIDYFRIENKKDPIFCTSFGITATDGGSQELYGLFYKINKYVKNMDPNDVEYEIGFWTLKFKNSEVNVYVEPYIDVYIENIL